MYVQLNSVIAQINIPKHINCSVIVPLVVLQELRLPAYKGQSPQLSLRRYFADLIAIVSNRFKLCPAARHLAAYLLDLFMDRYDISVQQLHMVALSCLLLASKTLLLLIITETNTIPALNVYMHKTMCNMQTSLTFTSENVNM